VEGDRQLWELGSLRSEVQHGYHNTLLVDTVQAMGVASCVPKAREVKYDLVHNIEALLPVQSMPLCIHTSVYKPQLGISIEVEAAGVGIPASCISVRYRSGTGLGPLIPLLDWFWHLHLCSFRYQTHWMPNSPIQIFSKIHRDIRKSRCTTGVNDTGGNFATG